MLIYERAANLNFFVQVHKRKQIHPDRAQIATVLKYLPLAYVMPDLANVDSLLYCNKCNNHGHRRRLFFPECSHGLCSNCVTDIIWEGEIHFLCCPDPFCPVCQTNSDITIETYQGLKKTIYEKNYSDDDVPADPNQPNNAVNVPADPKDKNSR